MGIFGIDGIADITVEDGAEGGLEADGELFCERIGQAGIKLLGNWLGTF